MNQRLFIASGLFLLAVGFGACLIPDPSRTSAEEATTGRRIVDAARGLLKALGKEERKKALFDYDDEERFNWHFIPRDRKGVSLKELDEEKQKHVAALLRASLSGAGYKRAEEVRELEAVLAAIEGPRARFRRDPLLYYVSFFDRPSTDAPWAWRFEGHHLCLNFTLKGAELLSSTPNFYGANPATVKKGPKKGLRVLAGTEDIARELVKSLDEEQLKRCLGKDGEGDKVPDEVPGTREPRYKGPFPAGVTAKDLERKQRRTLRRLIREYRDNLPEDVSKAIHAEIREAGFQNVRVAWSGGIEPWEPHSYLIHGPTFVINYSNRQNGANHIHACFRELKKDFAVEDE